MSLAKIQLKVDTSSHAEKLMTVKVCQRQFRRRAVKADEGNLITYKHNLSRHYQTALLSVYR